MLAPTATSYANRSRARGISRPLPGFRPTAFGNALGDSIVASAQPKGVDWSKAPDQSDAETARLDRTAVTQVDANTVVDDRPFLPSAATSEVYDSLVSMMSNSAQVDMSDATLVAAGPGFSLGRAAAGSNASAQDAFRRFDIEQMNSAANAGAAQQELERIDEVLRETRGRGLTRGALYADLAFGGMRDFDSAGQQQLLIAMDRYSNQLQTLELKNSAQRFEASQADFAVRAAGDAARESGAVSDRWRSAADQRMGQDANMAMMSGALMRRPREGSTGIGPEPLSGTRVLPEHGVAAQKGFPGVRVTENGGPTFTGTDYLYPVSTGQSNVVEITLTGSRRADFAVANRLAGLEPAVPEGMDAPKGYAWHHVDNYDPYTGRATLELVQQGAHRATQPHAGSVVQWEIMTGQKYKR